MEREKSKRDGECPVEPISSCRDEHGYVPTATNNNNNNKTKSSPSSETRWYLPGTQENQARGPWIRGLPLPLPVWAHYEAPTLTVNSILQYEELASSVELETQRLLRERRYDTLDNLLRFYRDFKQSGDNSLEHFYRKYQPLIVEERHTCVGLGLELVRRLCVNLECRFPGLSQGLYLASCEETIGDVASYVGGPPAADSGEKEHVLVCLKVIIGENRRGLLLLDPGYHVARVVTVMHDKMYPHTGWFTQSDEEGSPKKEFNYSFCSSDPDYVEWHERRTARRLSALETRSQVALVYVARPYLTAIDVTERRNLAYNYRSLLARDAKGHLTAGLYFELKSPSEQSPQLASFNIFHQTNTGKNRTKLPFAKFRQCPNKVELDQEDASMIAECARLMSMSQESLKQLLAQLATLIFDTSFTSQLLAINANINCIAKDN
ncbi:uncharacterized protein LOC131662887 [Phymastichus coffea]|uniref:uncharacterized protein LOC131662887 n=1 Tax=Phymastichus coffea TaxID=108790 RepID=UPI00273B9853|nr:uncharacterized protein LOC131662887 [Phymastichus coffea]